jgi:hypothetical protein
MNNLWIDGGFMKDLWWIYGRFTAELCRIHGGCMVYLQRIYGGFTSSTAQGGGGSFKNRKPIGEVGCCESGMAERSH